MQFHRHREGNGASEAFRNAISSASSGYYLLKAEVVEKLDDTICWSGVAFEVSARMLGSDRRH